MFVHHVNPDCGIWVQGIGEFAFFYVIMKTAFLDGVAASN